LSDPDQYIKNSTSIQQFQLKKGIQVLIKFMAENNIDFEICMRTRYDCKYPDNFFPNIPTYPNIIQNLAFNEHNHKIILNAMKEENVTNFHELLEFNKTHRLHVPYSHIPNHTHSAIAFGGMLCFNYESLQNIFDNVNQSDVSSLILYAFNDYFYFSKTFNFLKLQKLFDESHLFGCNNTDLYNHFFCPETQLIIFCLNNNINILMYPHWFYNDQLIYR
jgi:hypothetical protein